MSSFIFNGQIVANRVKSDAHSSLFIFLLYILILHTIFIRFKLKNWLPRCSLALFNPVEHTKTLWKKYANFHSHHQNGSSCHVIFIFYFLLMLMPLKRQKKDDRHWVDWKERESTQKNIASTTSSINSLLTSNISIQQHINFNLGNGSNKNWV